MKDDYRVGLFAPVMAVKLRQTLQTMYHLKMYPEVSSGAISILC